MIQNVLAFYKENQRYPNLKESEVLFEKLGCSNIRLREYFESRNLRGEIYEKAANYDCEYKSRTYDFSLSVVDLSIEHEWSMVPYEIYMSKGNTRCSSNFTGNGTSGSEGLGCSQFSCFKLSH